ncbi:putative protein TPRXL isoform X1 [Schistocerca americana]|uniref:putative protein TPRXL isoform X1 n=1 Tax=Schistocerca americana TaxID=7009 RepID=UPI001F500E2B|nr:putative protein TPRXL isoform X1 [Schistocerca americana]
MYRTVRHGENSLQYTILPQQDDLGNSGAASGAGPAGRRTRKAGGGRLKLALVLGVALVLAAGAVTTAVLVPLMIPRPHGAAHRPLTRHHHPPQNLLPARRPLHQSLEDPAPPPVAAAHRDAAPASSTEDPSLSAASSVSPAEDLAASSALYSEPAATEALTSTPATPAATSTQATTTTTASTTTTTTTTTTTPAPTTAAASTAAASASKGNADSTAGGGAVTEAVVHFDAADNGTDGGGVDAADIDDAEVDGPGDGGRGRGSGKPSTWLESRWPFGDASAYFEWTGFNGEDSVLLPLALAGVVLVLVIIIAACYAIRRHRHKVNRRQAIGKMSNELQSGDKATLLPDGSEDE